MVEFGADAAPVAREGVLISPAPAASRWSLRAKDADLLAGVIGRALPQKIGESLHGLAKLGPDEWVALLPAGEALPLGAGQALSIVDISSRTVGFRVEGPRAAAVISAGCALDMAKFAPGRVTRTLFETTEIILRRESETRFQIDVWRSFAPWLWGALTAAAG